MSTQGLGESLTALTSVVLIQLTCAPSGTALPVTKLHSRAAASGNVPPTGPEIGSTSFAKAAPVLQPRW